MLKETVLQRVSETATTSTYIKTHHNVLTTHFTSFIENYSKRLALTKGTADFTLTSAHCAVTAASWYWGDDDTSSKNVTTTAGST